MMKLFMVCLVVTGGLVREGRVKAQGGLTVSQDDNSQYFALLCKIYNVAQYPPIKPVDTKEYQKIVDDINALSAAANGKERVNTQSEETKSAQTELTGVTHEARKLLNEIKKINPEGQAEGARHAFNQVIFGEHGKEGDLYHGTLEAKQQRMAACGSKNKKGTSAGKNLIVDLFCLCANHDVAEGVDRVCGVSVGDGKDSGWGTNLYPKATMWDELKDGCKNVATHSATSTQDGYSLYDDFLVKVKAGGTVKIKDSTTVQIHGMLGTAVSKKEKNNFNCNGKKEVSTIRVDVAGVCVFYGTHHLEENIDWLKKFKNGLNIIDKLNTETASWQHQLTTLLNRARELYEKVKADTQLEEESTDDSPLAQHPNSDENENADSTTQSQRHSLLAWALLLQ
ncbi:Variant surface glycoprotein [Trypanosoma congolense IL3000]|uniref:Variant surface glycoprotein n=1 Tax=Trypanosoma congolense (strain IL3000) TaxID=1068625 RepID=F9W891_TRYCI|nr:Variant surface glycoprotein [Trypanosoma congolense IL3000]